MKTKTWLARHTARLDGKTVALTGSTGGLGKALSKHLVALGAHLILLDRNAERSAAHRQSLLAGCPSARITLIPLDLSDIQSVERATAELVSYPLDILIQNAGAYSIPRYICETGYDVVFQINFASPYYMIRRLLPLLNKRGGRVLVVGSIAHRYHKSDASDIDFQKKRAASAVYGNAKRYLMLSLHGAMKDAPRVSFAIAHPGITFTNITAHYPKPIFALIKYPMKLIFMRVDRAVLSILWGVFEGCGENEWLGPRLFDIWGIPKKKMLRSCTQEEILAIRESAEMVYQKCKACVTNKGEVL